MTRSGREVKRSGQAAMEGRRVQCCFKYYRMSKLGDAFALFGNQKDSAWAGND